MYLKRLYDWSAPQDDWQTQREVCPVCEGRGKVLSDDGSEIVSCPVGSKKAAEHVWHGPEGAQGEYIHKANAQGVFERTRSVPPVTGVEVLRHGERQNFSERLVFGAQREGWLSIEGNELHISGANKTLTYRILRPPGRYPLDDDGEERINHYECELVGEEA